MISWGRYHLVEKQLQYPAQVLVFWVRCIICVHRFEVGIQKSNNGHEQPLILNAGWTHLEKPAGMNRENKRKRGLLEENYQ